MTRISSEDHGTPQGTYAVLIALRSPTSIRFGAAGRRDLEPGVYAYVGSAFGPGGLEARVDRHRELAAGRRDARHWHVDYLLGDGGSELVDVVRFPGRRIECEVAGSLGGAPVDGIGASDCDCATHLAWVSAPGEAGTARRWLRDADG